MEGFVKNCKVHGWIKEEDARLESVGKGIKMWRCFKCRQITSKKQYAKNFARDIFRIAEWKKNNRDRINLQAREDRKKNPEKYKKWEKDYREKNKEHVDRQQMSYRFNMTLDDINKLLDASGGLCDICKRPETRVISKGRQPSRLCIDHCHDTNIIRGLLCYACNVAIGFMKDDIEIMNNAINYLKKHNKSGGY